MSFVHLHVHSDYSLLDGIGKCEEYAEKSVKYGMKHLCITDHGMMAAVPAQTQACNDYGLTPIYGIEAYINDYKHLLDKKELTEEEKACTRFNAHLVMWAKNDAGYKNLVRISSDAWINNFYYNPRTSKEFLKDHSEGIIASSACLAGEIPKAITLGQKDRARKLLNEYRDIFDEFYLELMLLPLEEQKIVNKALVEIAEEESLPLIVTNDVHFAIASDTEVQKVALLINSQNGTINNPAGLQFDSKELWFKSEEDLDKSYLEGDFEGQIPREIYEEAKANTVKIAESCKGVEIDTTPKLPTLENAEERLDRMVVEAMENKGLMKPEYKERLKNELAIIHEKGFASYFLIMKEIVDHVKVDMKSIVGPGRGSGPGFLVNYLLDLCTVDPIKYSLLSERFLSPHRGGKFAKLKFTTKPLKG